MRNNLRGLITVLILMAVFNVLSFVIPFQHGVVFWLSYCFGMLALVLQLPLLYIAFRKGDTPKSRFYGFPIAQIGGIYLVVQLVLSLLGMMLGKWILTWIVVVLYVLVLAAALIGFVAVDAMRDEIERQEQLVTQNVVNMRAIQSKANSLLNQYDGADSGILRKLVEEIRYSDPVSNDATMDKEAQLESLLNDLEKAIEESRDEMVRSLCKKGISTLEERNRLCKLNK